MALGARVLIAPDCFGDSLTAVQAAHSMAAGWRLARPADQLVLLPLSDGGPGFVAALTAGRRHLRVQAARVSGPLAEPVAAQWAFDPATATAYVESAQACGLALLNGPPTVHTAIAATSTGVGQLIDAAVGSGARTVVVGLGGSACTDGGRGMVEALGGLSAARRTLAAVRLIAATDVEHPLLGPSGAARVFGPQKGADAATVEFLEARLQDWAALLEADGGADVRELPGAGAAGGLGAALLALGARRESGAALIARHLGAEQQMASAAIVVTGEGRLDEQSLHGKVVGSLAAAARPHRLPVLVFAGQVALGPEAMAAAGIRAAYSVADYAGSVRRAIDDAAAQLSGLVERTAAALPAESEE
ncbi:glycerate kinase [Mycolicibacterium sp.]|uniref:glycerate kinase family protein n=1 Tax=Mycolicibacterium sp. TaxID=2320850 RepID=UPI0028A7CC75|nr:glycerate kinase [Mycolicibacterium sp.]